MRCPLQVLWTTDFVKTSAEWFCEMNKLQKDSVWNSMRVWDLKKNAYKYEGRLKSSWTHLITPWRCGDGLFFEVPPLASDALLTTLHPLLENMLQTVCRKLQEDIGTGGFQSMNFSNGPCSCSAIIKKGSFKTTETQTLTSVSGMKITPILRYPHH
jgi:hypothetical protein